MSYNAFNIVLPESESESGADNLPKPLVSQGFVWNLNKDRELEFGTGNQDK